MKLPCAVTRDLLPLYAENMVEQETKALVQEHLDECDDCREKLSKMSSASKTPIDTTKPLQNLKKQIRRKRICAAALAALLVFVGVYTYFFRGTTIQPIPWQDNLIEFARIETYHPEYADFDAHNIDTEGSVAPVPTTAPHVQIATEKALVFRVSSIVNGFEEHVVIEDDGTQTMVIQAVGVNQRPNSFAQSSYYEYTIFPVPDRVVYGLQQPQILLWGTQSKGNVEILPRLSLIYYLLISLVAAGVGGIIWVFLRKWKYSWILRQLFFAPLSYILSHLLLKGMKTTTFLMEQDLFSILLVALAIYSSLTIAWQMYLTRRKET